MASLIQSVGLLEHPLVAGGLPPSFQQQGEPVGLSGALLLVGFLALAFWASVRLVALIDVKLSSRRLFREIRRELGIGKDRPRKGA
jgi:hypothetical protein